MSDHPRVLLLPVVRKITFQLVYYQLYVLPHDSAYNAPCLCTWIRGHMQVHCVLMMDLSNLQSLCSIQLKKMLGSSGEWSSDINYSIYVFFFFFYSILPVLIPACHIPMFWHEPFASYLEARGIYKFRHMALLMYGENMWQVSQALFVFTLRS